MLWKLDCCSQTIFAEIAEECTLLVGQFKITSFSKVSFSLNLSLTKPFSVERFLKMALDSLLEKSSCFPVLHRKVVDFLVVQCLVNTATAAGWERGQKGELHWTVISFTCSFEIRSWQRWFKLLLRGKFASNKHPAGSMVIVTGYRMLGVPNTQKWGTKDRGGNNVSFGGSCSFRVTMKQGPVKFNHTKISDKKGAQNDAINAKSEPKVQSTLKTNTVL